ncbi:hypothetical protein LJC49_10980 [Ruminococcaceae bacterium OttesenSCG-928-I18]|nr:hypothetical protein [Ruminococcaceae bacterium OttesenSCG-928-I18]
MRQGVKRKEGRGYRRAMLALFVLLCIFVAITLALLWRVLTNYEAHTPRAALDHYFSLLDSRDYDAIKQDADFTPSDWNTWDDYFAYLESTFGPSPGGFTYRRFSAPETLSSSGKDSAPGDAQTQRYAVFDGEREIGQMLLYEDPDAAHGWRVSALPEYKEAYTVTAPGHAQVTVNNVPLDAEGEGVKRHPLDDFAAFPETSEAPVLLEYALEPTLHEPAFSATGPDGADCVVEIDETLHTVEVRVPLTGEQKEEYGGYMQAAAQSYASFVTDDNSLQELQSHLYPDTDLAFRMAGFNHDWYLEHEGFGFENIRMDNMVSCSETCFSGDIHFDYLIYQQGVVHTFPTSYHMSFTERDGQWLLLELQVR